MTQLTPSELITRLTSWFLRRDRDITLPSGRGIFITGANVEITTGGIVITGGTVTIDGSAVSVAGHAHTHASTTGKTTDDHHNEAHTVASHSDTSGTGSELNTLTDGSNADALHAHSAVGSHTIASHSDTTGTGAELETLTDGSDAGSLHIHDARYFQESEFSNNPGISSKPLETGSGGGLQVVGFAASTDIQAGSGLTVGSITQNPPGGIIMLPEQGTPSTPPSNWVYIYAKTDRRIYSKGDDGVEQGPL